MDPSGPAGVSSSHPWFKIPRVLPVNKQKRDGSLTRAGMTGLEWGAPTPSSVPSASSLGKTPLAWSQMTEFQEE